MSNNFEDNSNFHKDNINRGRNDSKRREEAFDSFKSKTKNKNSNGNFKRSKVSKQNEKNDSAENNLNDISDSRLMSYGINPKKFRNKLKYGSGKKKDSSA